MVSAARRGSSRARMAVRPVDVAHAGADVRRGSPPPGRGSRPVSWMSASRRLMPPPTSLPASWPVTFWIDAPMSLIFAIASSRLGGVVPRSTAFSAQRRRVRRAGDQLDVLLAQQAEVGDPRRGADGERDRLVEPMLTRARVPWSPTPSTWPTRTPAMRTEALSSRPGDRVEDGAAGAAPCCRRGCRSSIFQIRTARTMRHRVAKTPTLTSDFIALPLPASARAADPLSPASSPCSGPGPRRPPRRAAPRPCRG